MDDDRACAHEECGKAWVIRWNGGDPADAQTHHPVAKLGDGGVGEDALDVVLQ